MSDQVDADETPDVKKWKVEAQKFQQEMLERLGDREWDEWEKSDQDILSHKVRSGLYFFPERNTEEWEESQSEIVELLADTILKNAENGNKIHFSCIFIFVVRKGEWFYVPVFKIKGKQDQTLFVDSECHVYENWQNYLSYNHLPECLYCSPRDGLYQANENQVVLVDFCRSPACDPKLKILYNYSSILKIMSSLLIDTPIQAPTQLTSALLSEVCNTAQSAEDQKLHGHKTVPNVFEASGDHLRIRSNVLKVVQNLMYENITLAAAAGEIATTEEAIAYDVVTYNSCNLSLTVNGLQTLRDMFVLIDKKNKGSLTDDDILNFEASVLFFNNNLLQENMAIEVIEDIQQKVLNQHCDNLTPSQIDGLFKLFEFSKGKTQLQRNANNIKAINRIFDKQTFYESLVTIKGDLEDHQVGFSSEEPGVININNELLIAPNKFVEISAIDRLKILDATKKFQANGIAEAYRSTIEEILKKNRIVMQWQRDKKIAQLKKAFNTENLDTIKIGGKQIFKNMTPSELDRLSTVIAEAGKYCTKILKITNEFANMRNCKNPRDYSHYVEFVKKYTDDVKEEKITAFKQAAKDAKINRRINEQTFYRENGIKGKMTVHLSNQVYDHFFEHPEENFKPLEEKYLDLAKNVLPLNATMVPNFASDVSAIYHYYKHRDFNKTRLTEQKYFALASELVNEPLNKRSAQLNQQGDQMVMLFTNPVNGAKGIVFEKLIDGALSLATVFFDNAVFNPRN